MKRCLAGLPVLAGLLAFPAAASGERLPIQRFTAADGLAHDRVLRIVRDSRGFLWFCTAGGLSRFDGRTFVTLSSSSGDGLPVRTLLDLIENPDGSYWLATNGDGIVRYDPDSALHGGRRFTPFAIGTDPAANRVNRLFRDRAGRLWIGTDGGLFAFEGEIARPVFRRVALGHPSHSDEHLNIWSVVEDDGSLWIGTSAGLVRRLADGRSFHYSIRPGRSADHVWELMIDPDERLWIGHDTGLLRLDAIPETARHMEKARDASLRFADSRGLPTGRINALLRTTDGRFWISTDADLTEFASGRVNKYSATHGLEGSYFRTLAEDVYGNIWTGTAASGAIRIARDGLATYTKADGLSQEHIGSLFETTGGQLCAVTRGPRINVFDGRRFRTVVPNLGRAGGPGSSNEAYAVALNDHQGEWWIPSGDTLYRFPSVPDVSALTTTRPTAVYRFGGRSASGGIWRLFEDSRGDVWIANRVAAREVLTRWERTTGVFHRYASGPDLPASAVHMLAEDRSGNVWIGFWDAGLGRFRDGRFQHFSTGDGVPLGGISSLQVDRDGRVWCGTVDGLYRIDAPDADRPLFVRTYSTKNGLADDVVKTLMEDRSGRLYVGTRRGLDRLDPASGRIRHYTIADGLAALESTVAYQDRHGTLWYGTSRGLSRLLPVRETPQSAPAAALLSHVTVDGNPAPLSDLGDGVVGPLNSPSAGSRIEIGFFALSFAPGDALKYQYRLDGVDAWSPPTDQQTVIYPRLAPGNYRFLVRAVRGDGSLNPTPASLTFTVPPPLWARWWFLAAAVTLVGLAVHSAYRFRLARLLEIERIRTRLAMDLHDDIGSTLSQVAVLSAVARQRVGGDGRLAELLDRIADNSRHLIDTMGDVVWAINPARDSLRDLVQRMRRFAAETLDTQNIQFHFDAPGGDVDMRLGAEVRREVFLIFKEAISNLVRYSKCAHARVGLTVQGGSLVLTIADDGVGLNPAEPGDGLGLRSMRERAGRLGAELRLRSAPEEGTTVRLAVPLRRQRRRGRAA